MKKQIRHLSIHQTSKVIAAMHAAMLAVLFILPTALGYIFHGYVVLGILCLLIVPWIVWLFIYIGYVIACWFYNLVVPWTGGIEFEMEDAQTPAQKVEIEEKHNLDETR